MPNQDPELLEKIRQQFDSAPYPRTPLEQSPKTDYELLFIHNLATCYYLKYQKVINTEGKIILDAGCGTGYKSLVLAEANPGAKIVGIDISEQSIELARQRLKFHGFDNAEFYVLPIENLPQLRYEFDYINNDESLYLFPDITVPLKAMRSVLKPEGIIRSNLHSAFQRVHYFRAQSLFKMMGLMDDNPTDLEIELTGEIMQALKDQVFLKSQTYNSEKIKEKEWVLMNYLFQGDKGYTIPELFAALRNSDLELISMVKWRNWEVIDLFKDAENLPAFLGMSLPELSIEDRLHFYELLHPIHRLLDFWCGHPIANESIVPVSNWTDTDWQTTQVHLHPQLKTSKAKDDLIECVKTQKPFEISQYVKLPTLLPITIESRLAACLLPLWETEQPIISLVERWQQIQPIDPVTLEPITPQIAFEQVKELLTTLDAFLYVLLERSGSN
ncbi:class I SAM-dependent methyltransferase [Planktothrix agardhii 1029]|uniref:class I SAM-dependent methyltransferase n=1 Tax=Planktothrix agardhii TaxID=1160 RepID=UPI001D0B94DF|nr:class I SAM-dependent methyltransferase [Planktothrix agardhii]MCB8764885.1 class I SAM-dependent methyltransferase [Planktothrix agardhii 1809]MCB8782942.1 class I SAM-dependent methyltransferase [Planktothrix agardhii 1808]MCF3566032.1 class I SAM-dependent methyltransferase [Planktothrix agardhii 1807]MCF3589215.1 class I SAM-dependent methyltransferase [Planktothrix agardhii 1029]MCF3621320.1 class I SAM-dependent methyltransferase [Planktothrix agardhii 1030]